MTLEEAVAFNQGNPQRWLEDSMLQSIISTCGSLQNEWVVPSAGTITSQEPHKCRDTGSSQHSCEVTPTSHIRWDDLSKAAKLINNKGRIKEEPFLSQWPYSCLDIMLPPPWKLPSSTRSTPCLPVTVNCLHSTLCISLQSLWLLPW